MQSNTGEDKLFPKEGYWQHRLTPEKVYSIFYIRYLMAYCVWGGRKHKTIVGDISEVVLFSDHSPVLCDSVILDTTTRWHQSTTV